MAIIYIASPIQICFRHGASFVVLNADGKAFLAHKGLERAGHPYQKSSGVLRVAQTQAPGRPAGQVRRATIRLNFVPPNLATYKHAAAQQLEIWAREIGWSVSALKRLRTAAKEDKSHVASLGPTPQIPQTQIMQVTALCDLPENS